MYIEQSIVGMRYHEGAVDYLFSIAPGTKLYFEREPDNSHDANAIALYSAPSGRDSLFSAIKLGYIPSTDAAFLAKQFDAHLIDNVCIFKVMLGLTAVVKMRANFPQLLIQELCEKCEHIGDGVVQLDEDVFDQVIDLNESYKQHFPEWRGY